MRDPNRIEPFCQELAKIWKAECPDWRFGQLIDNVFTESGRITFYTEDDKMIQEFRNYFNKGHRKTRRRKDEPRERKL